MTDSPEFSRPLEVASVLREGSHSLAIEASDEERAALVRRLGLADLSALRAELSLASWQGGGLMIFGALTADLSQICVVTLEPVPARLNEPVEARYLPRADVERIIQDASLSDPVEPDPPEVLPERGVIDLGELVVQHLAVALDPYPRKPGVAFVPPEEGADAPAASPFAKLAALKRPPKG